MTIDLVANSSRICQILKYLEGYIVQNPDATKEEVFTQLVGALQGDVETATEAFDLLASEFRKYNSNPDMNFDEMKEQVIVEATMDMPDTADLDLSGL